MIKQKIYLTILLFTLLFPIQNVLADDAISTSSPIQTATSTQGSVLGLQAPAIPPIIAAINSAKAQLTNVTLNHQLIPVYKKNTKKINYLFNHLNKLQ